MNAMVIFEKVTGKSFLQGFKWGELTASDWQILLHSCLVHEDKTLAFDAVGEMVDADNWAEVRDAIIKACAGKSQDNPPNAESLSTG
jgi:hypothetical protein